jgi:hypothetical protein
MISPLMLFAQVETISHRFGRLGSFTEWWHWLLLVVVCLFIAGYTVWMYRRDTHDVSRALAVVLTLLRLTAFCGILFYFFKLERRFERQLEKPSRALVLVDTSQSMSIRDSAGPSSTAGLSRSEQISEALRSDSLIPKLRRDHDVIVYRFDEDEKPIELATYAKLPAEAAPAASPEASLQQALKQVRWFSLVCGILFAISLVTGASYFWFSRAKSAEHYGGLLIVSVVALIASGVVLGTALVRDPQLSVAALLGVTDASAPKAATPEATPSIEPAAIDWTEQVAPRGVESRLGDALLSLLNEERGGTAAGIFVLTDGNRNAGVDMSAVIPVAQDAGIPIFAVGLGSNVLPVNARVVDLEAPQRAYAGDKFTLTGHVQITGLPRAELKLELVSQPVSAATRDSPPLETLEAERTIELVDGQIITARFDLEADADHAGQRDYRLRIKPLANETDPQDNMRAAKVDIVDRKDKILLLAGGPMREFIFLRNQLFRDQQHSSHVTVLLQSARPGISQEAHEIIHEFPTTADDLFQYDCIVAFDPDWEALDDIQIDLLERFVAEKAGGLILLAGPVFTPQWSTRRDAGKLRVLKKLYPVVFYNPAVSVGLSRFGSSQAWPLEFSREGEEASYLWLGDDSNTSRKNWNATGGMFGYYAVKDAKPGATVLARYADPEAKLEDTFPIYMAAQFYGAGRVFFLGSGEMWRMRSRDESLFEEFYTKLIRWTAEGRLLRNSTRGTLLVDKERCFLGERVTVRASLQNKQHQPLTVPEVTANLVLPNGKRSQFVLRKIKDGDREGLYTEQFVAMVEGDYRIELVPPQGEDELLLREVRVRLPDSELRDVKRNDALLQELADRTSGQYFVGLPSLLDAKEGATDWDAKLIPKDQITVLPSTPDKKFEERLMGWLIGFLSGVLCLEWLLRRWNKLA